MNHLDGIIEKQRIGAPGEAQMPLDVIGSVLQAHPADGEPGPDPLVQRSQNRQLEPAAQRGLADEQQREVRFGVHAYVGEHPPGLEFLVGQQVRLVDHDHRQPGALIEFPVQQGCGLGGQHPGKECRCRAEGGDDRRVDPTDPDRGARDIDHLVAGGFQPGQGRAGGHGLPRPDFPDDHPHRTLVDAPLDAGHRFAVPGMLGQRLGRFRPAEGQSGEPEIRLQGGGRT